MSALTKADIRRGGQDFVYTGDSASYGVTVVAASGPTARVVIVSHLSPECSIPIGVVVTILARRLTKGSAS